MRSAEIRATRSNPWTFVKWTSSSPSTACTARAAASVAWPQSGISIFGEKYRMENTPRGPSRAMKAVSERLNSRAIDSIWSSLRGASTRQTAAGLPRKGRSVNASITNAFMAGSCRPPVRSSRRPVPGALLERQQGAVDAIVGRRRHTGFARQAHHGAGQVFELGGSPRHEIPLHRRGGVDGQGIGESEGPLDGAGPEMHTPRARQVEDLLHRAPEQVARLRLVANDAGGPAGEGSDAGEGGDEQELLPDRRLDVLRDGGGHAGGVPEGCEQRLGARGAPVVRLAELDGRGNANVVDRARRGDVAHDAAETRQDAIAAGRLGELPGGFDAVLEGNDDAPGTEHREHRPGGLANLPRLDADEDGLHPAGGFRIVGGLGGPHDEVPRRALDAQAVPTDGVEMRPARHEHDGVARPGQPAAEVSPDAPGPEHRDAHRVTLPWRSFLWHARC